MTQYTTFKWIKSPALSSFSDDRTSVEVQCIHKYRHIDMHMHRLLHSSVHSNFASWATFQKIKEFRRKIIFLLKSIKWPICTSNAMLAFNIRILFINVSYYTVPSLINVAAFSYSSDSFNLVSWMERGNGSQCESLLSTRRIQLLLASFKVFYEKRR